MFVQCIGQLITNLKSSGVIHLAYISPSDAVNKCYYSPLYSKINKSIDLVDYQFQNEQTPVPSPDDLVERYKSLTKIYLDGKLFAGYSAEIEDWEDVSPIVFFAGGFTLTTKYKAPGISIYYHNFGKKGPQAKEQESDS